jgi:hypothetical protein
MQSMQTQLDEMKRAGYVDSDECCSDDEQDSGRSRPQKAARRPRGRGRYREVSESDDEEPIPEYVSSSRLAGAGVCRMVTKRCLFTGGY